MKVHLSLLIILLMAGACWSGPTCRLANWWFTFDHEGWSACNPDQYVTGFYRNRRTYSDPIYLLEEARCCKAPPPYEDASSTCEHRNWWSALDRLVSKTKSNQTNIRLSKKGGAVALRLLRSTLEREVRWFE